ncbi:MAG: hypothetical protein RL701_6066 [Pseudomonadota bacterium]|jgi:hypothetical protein
MNASSWQCAVLLCGLGFSAAGACRSSGEVTSGQTPLAARNVTAASDASPNSAPSAPAPARAYVAARVPLGVNLSAVNYYATALPFVDVMKMADPFLSTHAPSAAVQPVWDTELADKIARDENGYPLEAPTNVPGAAAPQILRASTAATLYGGHYVVLYDGDGELEFPASPATVSSRAPGRVELDVLADPQRTLFVAIVRSNRLDHVRNIRVLLPGYERSYAREPFHPTFLSRLAGVGALRFMDWGATNNHALARWSERTLPQMQQGGARGVAYEYMIDLANRVGADPWFCIPHRADDTYVTELAKLIKSKLDPKRRFYIEYSNELWNGIFEQAAWAKEQGCRAGLNKHGQYAGSCADDGARHWAGVKWNARRSGEIFRSFDAVFAETPTRFTRVLAGQAQNEHLNAVLLASFADAAINPAQNRADVLAIAPYVGGSLASEITEHAEAASMTVPALIERLDKLVASEVSEPTRANRALAQKHGLRLIAYEAGQHLVAYGAASQNQAFVDKLIAANRDTRMRSVYMHMLDAWYANSDQGLLMLFNYIETPNKYGVWGLLEHQEQSMAEAPKYQAFFDRLQRLGSPGAQANTAAPGSVQP